MTNIHDKTSDPGTQAAQNRTIKKSKCKSGTENTVTFDIYLHKVNERLKLLAP